MERKLFKSNIPNAKIITESIRRFDESKDKQKGYPILGSARIKGMTVENALNQNGRKYPMEAWSSPLAFGAGGKFIKEDGQLEQLTLFGSLDHPVNDYDGLLLEDAGIVWTEVTRNPDGSWDGSYDVLDTPKGKTIWVFHEYAKLKGTSGLLGVSSRAWGDTTLEEDASGQYEKINPETFELVAFDFVYDPSFAGARVITESKSNGLKSITESIKRLGVKDKENKKYYEAVANMVAGVKTEESKVAKPNKETKNENKKGLRILKPSLLKEANLLAGDEIADGADLESWALSNAWSQGYTVAKEISDHEDSSEIWDNIFEALVDSKESDYNDLVSFTSTELNDFLWHEATEYVEALGYVLEAKKTEEPTKPITEKKDDEEEKEEKGDELKLEDILSAIKALEEQVVALTALVTPIEEFEYTDEDFIPEDKVEFTEEELAEMSDEELAYLNNNL